MAKVTHIDPRQMFRQSAFHPNYQLIQNFNQTYYPSRGQLSRTRQNKKLIFLNDPLRTKWDFFIILLTTYSCIFIPFSLSFDPKLQQNFSIIFIQSIIDLSFMLDIYLNFRTSFIHSKTGQQIVDLKKIAKHYCQSGRLAIDLLSCIPLDFFSLFFQVQKQMYLLKLLKLSRVFRLNKIIQFLHIKQDLKTSIQIGRLVFVMVLYNHWIACGWNSVVYIQQTWQDISGEVFFQQGVLRRYLFSFYIALATIVGYQINPSNRIEYLYCMFWVLTGALMITYIIGQISTLVMNLQNRVSNFYKIIDLANTVMANLRLKRNLKLRINTYITNTHAYITHQQDYKAFRKVVSKQYIQQIHGFLFNELVGSNRIIKEFPQSIKPIVQKMDCMLVRPDKLVIQQGDQADYFYLVGKGVLEVLKQGLENSSHIVRHLQYGDYFGEISILYDIKRTASVRSIDYCNMGILKKEDFISVTSKSKLLVKAMKKKITQLKEPFKQSIMKILKKISYLNNLDILVLDSVYYSLKQVYYENNVTIFQEGDVSDTLFILMKGSVILSTSIYDTHLQYQQIGRCSILQTKIQNSIQRGLQYNKYRRKQKKSNKTNIQLGHLEQGSILCASIFMLNDFVNFKCISDSDCVFLTLKSWKLELLQKGNPILESRINRLKLRLKLQFSPPICDYYKYFEKYSNKLDIRSWKAKKNMINLILSIMHRNRNKKSNKIISLRELVLRLKAIKQAESHGWSHITALIQNRSFSPLHIQIAPYLRREDMKNVLIHQFASWAITANSSYESLAEFTEKVQVKFYKLENMRECLQEQLDEVFYMINLVMEYVKCQLIQILLDESLYNKID